MSIPALTVNEHKHVVECLIKLGTRVKKVPIHSAGLEYTSLMISFLMHNISSADSLLKLLESYGEEWFPTTVGFIIARTMFELDVNAHYISMFPKKYSQQYIKFGRVLRKKNMDACQKHRSNSDAQWRDSMNSEWEQKWSSKQKDIDAKFLEVKSHFQKTNKKGKTILFNNWCGKKIREMAEEVQHLEAYEIFYSELSSFSHSNILLADRFLSSHPDGFYWSQRSKEVDVGNVFRYVATFLNCFMELFSENFNIWSKADLHECWNLSSNFS